MQDSTLHTPSVSAANALTDRLVEHWEWTRTLARQIVRDPHQAEDVAQEAWLRGRDAWRGDVHPGFFATIVRNLTRDRARAAHRQADWHRQQRTVEVAPSAEDLAVAAETGKALSEAVLELPEHQRDVILKRYFEGLSNAEIARSLELPEGTVRSRLKRGLDSLRAEFEGEGRATDKRSLFALGALSPRQPRVCARSSRLPSWGMAGSALLAAAALIATVLMVGRDPASTVGTQQASRAANIPAQLVAMEPTTSAGARRQVAVAALPQDSPTDTVTMAVTGRVLDSDRKPIDGATATFAGDALAGEPITVTVDKNGGFRLSAEFAPGKTATLSITAGRFVAQRNFPFSSYGLGVNRPPSRGERDLGDVILSPRSEVSARVTLAKDLVARNASLWLTSAGDSYVEHAETNDEGALAFLRVTPGRYHLKADLDGFKPFKSQLVEAHAGRVSNVGEIALVALVPEEEILMDFEVLDHNETNPRGGTFATGPVFMGNVVRNGEPVAGIDVTACLIRGTDDERQDVPLASMRTKDWLDRVTSLNVERSSVRRAVTDVHGRFVLRGIEAGASYQVVAWGQNDHAVVLPAIAAKAKASLKGDVERATSLGKLQLVAYASVDLQVEVPKGVPGSAFEVVRRGLDSQHFVGADTTGLVRLPRVIAGPHVLHFQYASGVLASTLSTKFEVDPGQHLTIPVDATRHALTTARVTVRSGEETMKSFTTWFFPEELKAPWPNSLEAGRAKGLQIGLVAAETGAAEGFVRTLGPSQVVLGVGSRLINVPLCTPNFAPLAHVDVDIVLPAGGTLVVTLPESVEALERGELEFEGAGTRWSVKIQDGLLVDPPFGVTAMENGRMRVDSLHLGDGRVSVIVRDTESRGEAKVETGFVLFERSASFSFTSNSQETWSLR